MALDKADVTSSLVFNQIFRGGVEVLQT